jgi:hypothetical protein
MARTSRFALLILVFCVSRLAFADEPVSISPASPERVQQTVQRAIGYLQTESAAWLHQRRCAACHHAAMPLWALSEADRQGYVIDKKFVQQTVEATLGSVPNMIAAGLANDPTRPPDTRPMARGVNTGQVFMAVAARSLPSLEPGQRESLKRIADDIVSKQQADGSWEFFLRRPPINESQATDAAWIVMALQGETGADAPASHQIALEMGIAWLARAEPRIPQVKVLNLLVSLRARMPREKLQSLLDALLAAQRPDGGWSQTTDLPSDAFATGQTLYVLSLAGYPPTHPQIHKAIAYLLATQNSDGSWPMTSRSTPDGSPGGAKLLTPITCGASAWATLGLTRAVPKAAGQAVGE